MTTSSILVLRDFAGTPEITPGAQELKRRAIELAKPMVKVETEHEQALAVGALRELKAIRSGMESTRKAVKAPVIELGKKIDSIAADFLTETDREEMRLQGLINHFQRKQLELKREEEQRVAREQAETLRLEEEARRKREQAERDAQAAKTAEQVKAAEKLRTEAASLEAAALDKSMATELAPVAIVPAKPKGLVVKSKLNFEVTNAIVFCQAYPQFFSWSAEAETLKLKRREILEELNREDGRGIFHRSHFPEELPTDKQQQLVKPPGMRVFEETKSHVR